MSSPSRRMSKSKISKSTSSAGPGSPGVLSDEGGGTPSVSPPGIGSPAEAVGPLFCFCATARAWFRVVNRTLAWSQSASQWSFDSKTCSSASTGWGTPAGVKTRDIARDVADLVIELGKEEPPPRQAAESFRDSQDPVKRRVIRTYLEPYPFQVGPKRSHGPHDCVAFAFCWRVATLCLSQQLRPISDKVPDVVFPFP